MSMGLMQQGSAGPMRDLDYINPRPRNPPSALPPEVRRKLGLRASPGSRGRCSSEPPPETESRPEIYAGAANADPKVGKSGAGTDWVNPNGHAFVKRGSGVPMSQRASRKAQLAAAGAAMLAGPPSARGGGGGGLPSLPTGSSALPPLPSGRRKTSDAPPRQPSRQRRMVRAASVDGARSHDTGSF